MCKFNPTILTCLIGFCVVSAKGQATNTITFTNKYKEVIHAEVVRADSKGIVYKEINSSGMGRVAFSNLPTDIQLRFGYDAEKVRKAQEEIARQNAVEAKRLAMARAAQERASQHNSIRDHDFYLNPINESDFPETEKVQAICKEITSELNGINKALELGLNYNKFSDLLTEKVLNIQKIKDLRGEGLHHSFLYRVDECIDSFKESREWWHKKIEDSARATAAAFEDYIMRKHWSAAGVHLTYCIGMAEKHTNANALAIEKVALMIKTEQDAVKDGILEAKDYRDPAVANLSVQEISTKIKIALSETNTPSIGTQP